MARKHATTVVFVNIDNNSHDFTISHFNVKLHRIYDTYGALGSHGGSEGKASACSVGGQVRSLGWEDPLEKEMAAHSSSLAWRIPWTEEPGGLQSMGSQRVGHD